jgi:hypothetical protein
MNSITQRELASELRGKHKKVNWLTVQDQAGFAGLLIVKGTMTGDRNQPRADGITVFIELPCPAPGFKETILNKIFRDRRIVNDPQDDYRYLVYISGV